MKKTFMNAGELLHGIDKGMIIRSIDNELPDVHSLSAYLRNLGTAEKKKRPFFKMASITFLLLLAHPTVLLEKEHHCKSMYLGYDIVMPANAFPTGPVTQPQTNSAYNKCMITDSLPSAQLINNITKDFVPAYECSTTQKGIKITVSF